MEQKALKDKYKDEQVLSIKNLYLELLDREDVDKVQALFTLIKDTAKFEYRYEAEIDFEKKQVIPYVVLKHNDKYFVTKRIQGDSRLVGGLSVAVGGHINPCDATGVCHPAQIVLNCIDRELTEETTVKSGDIEDLEFVTTFVDESAPVSKVHICLLTKVLLNTDDIYIKETDKLEGCWMDINEIKEHYDQLEGWSKIAIDLLEEEGM